MRVLARLLAGVQVRLERDGLAAVVSVFYYFSIAEKMFLQDPHDKAPLPTPMPIRLALYVTLFAIFVLGAMPGPVLGWCVKAGASLF